MTFSLLGHAGVALFVAHHALAATATVARLHAALAEYDFVSAENDKAPAPEAPPMVLNAAAASRAPVVRATPASGAANTKTEVDAQPAAAAPTAARDSTGPHFIMTVAPAVRTGTGIAKPAVASSGAGPSSGIGQAPIAAATADIPAKLRSGSVPAYTAAALAAGVEANVPLEIVIDESGIVVSARVLERVGYGLDEAARQGMLAYRFTPAMRGGKPTAVRMQWLMRFQLR